MGAACCVAARDGTVQHGTRTENFHRNVRHSPSWSFRWDNRVRVAGEETSVGWLSDGVSRNDALDRKSSTGVSAHASDGGSSLETYVTGSWSKSPLNEAVRSFGTPASGKSISTKLSMEESAGSQHASNPPSMKLSPSAHSTPSGSTSPLSFSQTHLRPPASVPSSWGHRSPGHEPSQGGSDSQSSERNSPTMGSFSEVTQVSQPLPAGSNESTSHSVGRSSDGWSLFAFSELLSTSRRERRSFSSESQSVTHDKMMRWSDRNPRSASVDLRTCGVCSKLLTHKSPWSSQKIFAGNELSVVAVLVCGHVYHAECLEHTTPEINKYDPACPVCSLGEKALRLSTKSLKAEKDSRFRSHKKSKNRIVDTDDSTEFDSWKRDAREVNSPKLVSSSSLKISSGKPFLKRHFSFGSRGAKSTSETSSLKRKGLFWVKSSKE